MRCLRFSTLVLGLIPLTQSVTPAQTTYKIEPIIKLGDKVADAVIKTDGGHFDIGTLNDNGQLVFVTENAAGGEMVIQYAEGNLTSVVIGDGNAPGGRWDRNVTTHAPVNMNQQGNIVFVAEGLVGSHIGSGTFLWDYQARKYTPVALKGMSAVNNLIYENGGGPVPVINDRNEMAFVPEVKNAVGEAVFSVFFLGRDGRLLPVALPGQGLPGGRKAHDACFPSLNEAGAVAFLARHPGEEMFSAYLWEQGVITPLALVGADAPGGGRFAAINGVRVNKNGNVLVMGRLHSEGPDALYLFAGGKLSPLVVPGQEMPGGGKFKDVYFFLYGLSFANEKGQYALLARLDDGAMGAYLLDGGGKLSLLLKSGTTTDLGMVTHVGDVGTNPPSLGIGLNSKGQVALTVRIDGRVPTIVLLTPGVR